MRRVPIPPRGRSLRGAIRPRTAYACDELARLTRLSALARRLDPSPRSLPA